MFEFLKHLFKLQFLVIIIAVIVGIYYPQIVERLKHTALIYLDRPDESIPIKFEAKTPTEILFTKESLAKFNGENDTPLYLALLGTVYDVSKGIKHYGSGCAYNFFIGRDASVSFVTGEFEQFDEDNADDVLTLKPNDLLSLMNWKRFYDKDYTYKGKLIGRFYDEQGQLTTYHHKFLALVEQAEEVKSTAEQLRTVYPDCNIQWSEETGTRVWCTTMSGGKERSWSGHPRKLFELGSESFRCACIRTEDLDTTAVMIKTYDNCESLADECFYQL